MNFFFFKNTAEGKKWSLPYGGLQKRLSKTEKLSSKVGQRFPQERGSRGGGGGGGRGGGGGVGGGKIGYRIPKTLHYI